MIKKILTGLFLVTTILNVFGQEKFRYTIEGSVANTSHEGKQVYLRQDGIYGKGTFRDSTRIRNGKFKFQGNRCEWPHMYSLSIGEQWINVVLEAGIIKTEFGAELTKISGTPINNSLYKNFILPSYQVRAIRKPLDQAREEALKQKQWTTKDEAEYIQKLPSQNQLQAGKLHFVKTYAKYPVVDWFVFEMMTYPFPDKELPGILNSLSEDSRKRLDREMDKYRQMQAELLKTWKPEPVRDYSPDSVETGKQFIDVRGITVSGDTMGISSFMAGKKLTLIDFWASWCGPCMKAMPEVATLYDKYQKKGLEIIGLSSDVQPQAWTKAIKEKQMTWPQLLEYKGNDKSPSEIYGIIFIPYTILVDAEGHIVARNLKGAELTAKIAEILD